ncbi:MAG: 1,4-dihydroxy-2-naphthoate octaprenyltransferase [Bacteroidales bacterium]|nr:1,4-dihydroxy-2-naphthoate octaprenyltransferase [Bacteroidales bacterium]
MNTIKKWFFVTRPWSFVVSATPVIATSVFLIWKGYGPQFDWVNAVLALVGIMLFHAAGNVFSDYKDYLTGVDSKEAFCIPNLVSGEFKAEDYKRYALLLFFASCAVGLVLTFRSGWALLAVGIPGLILTLLYSKTKFIALGDLDIFVVFGLLPMLGTSYVTVGVMDWSTLLLSIPVGIVTVAVLHANNTRDIPTDSRAGAKSFAALIGEKASVRLYQAYMWTPIAYTAVMAVAGLFPFWTFIFVLCSAVIALQNTRQAQKYFSEGLAAFNQLDLMTAKLQMFSGLGLILGFIVAAL